MRVHLQALMMAIQTALENGMDDDCDTYYEAGILLDDLENGTGTIRHSTTVDNLLEADGLFGLRLVSDFLRLSRLITFFCCCLCRGRYR